MIKQCILVPLFFLSTLVFGEAEDFTDDAINYISDGFIGLVSEGSYTWDHTTCIKSPTSGRCAAQGGYKVYGTGHGKVTELVKNSGQGWWTTQEENPWNHSISTRNWIDINLIFKYEGVSHGKRQCYPGNFQCATEWGKLHPTGLIMAHIISNEATGVTIEMSYRIKQGNGDRPNKVVRIAMDKLKYDLKNLVTQYSRARGSQAIVRFTESGK